MVSFVFVTHSALLAQGIVEEARMMAPHVPMLAAGGTKTGALGTSEEKIDHAIRQLWSEDGVIVLMDMGSSVLTARLVAEDWEGVYLADCPIVEGAVTGSVLAETGADLQEILSALSQVAQEPKL